MNPVPKIKGLALIPYIPYFLIAGVIYYLYRKFFGGFSNNILNNLTKEEEKALAINGKTSLGSSAISVNIVKSILEKNNHVVNASHISSANSLEQAIFGPGTDWSRIKTIKTMAPLTLQCVYVAYGVRSVWLGGLWWENGNLIDHLQSDLSESEFNELQPFFKKANIL